MSEISTFQYEIARWSLHNFGDLDDMPPIVAVVGLGEEVGEIQRALLKQHQGIRGTYEEWQEELAKELGDAFIKLCDVAFRARLELAECVENRWESIRQRDFKADAKGHGLPNG